VTLGDIQKLLRDPRLLGGPLLPTLNVKLSAETWIVVMWDSRGRPGTGEGPDLETAVAAAFRNYGVDVWVLARPRRETLEDDEV